MVRLPFLGKGSRRAFHWEVGGVVLAGGMSRRMAGAEKAFVPLAGRPLLSHVLDRLTPQVDRVILSANGDLNRFMGFGLDVVADMRPDQPGPLAGLESAFRYLSDLCWILSVPVDLPFFPMNLLQQMTALADDPKKPVVAVSNGRLHPVVCLWPRGVAGEISNALDAGTLRLLDFFDATPHHRVEYVTSPGGPDPFFNINRPEQVVIAERFLGIPQP